jgi:hypothetical protein
MSKYEYKGELLDVISEELRGPGGYDLMVDLNRSDGEKGKVLGARVKHIGTQEVFYSGEPDAKSFFFYRSKINN